MDVSQYLEIFIDESGEHLQTLSDCIMELEKEPDNKDTINEIFRAAHSLKGMAGTMGFKRMQHLTHDMENVFQEVRNDTIKVDSQMIDLLFKCLDAIDGYLENIKASSDEGEEDNEVIIRELNNFLAKAEGKEPAPQMCRMRKKKSSGNNIRKPPLPTGYCGKGGKYERAICPFCGIPDKSACHRHVPWKRSCEGERHPT